MAPPARPDIRPDFWPDLDLARLERTETGGFDARAVLLKINAEMFVAAPARDREMIETFQSLALGFLPRVDSETLVEIGRILAPCEDTPASIRDHLARHAPEMHTRRRDRPAKQPVSVDDKLLGTPEGRLQLAAQPALNSRTVERLLVLHEDATDATLAANPGIDPAGPAFKEVVRRAQGRPTLARIVLERADLTLAVEAALYLAASPERRSLIREGVAVSVAAQRATVSFRLSEHDVDEFYAASLQGNVRQMERLLTDAFGFPVTTDWRILEIGRHDLLALALKALGRVEKEAIRMFLTLHPALSHSLSKITGLARVMRDVPSPVALALVEAILGVEALSARSARHRL